MKFNLQFFGGRGGSSHSGGGGGGGSSAASENRKGSASNPVKASELTAMNEEERISALNAMPVGTRVRSSNDYYVGDVNTYVKFEDGWKMEQTYQAVSRGRLVNRVHYPRSFTPDQLAAQSISQKGSTDVLRTTRFTTFKSVKYPKK